MAHPEITVVMYHYVRELAKSRYPRIRGLDYVLFKEQIRFMRKNYSFISAEDLIAFLDNGQKLPEKAILLTFDDCYTDHFTHVFPVLNEHGVKAAFYGPVQAVRERKVLDVNKIHLILASAEENVLLKLVKEELENLGKDFELETTDKYWSIYGKPTLFDTAGTTFIKRMLQDGLKGESRVRALDSIFHKIIDEDEAVISSELYLNEDQMRCMIREGMHFGVHGYSHTRFHTLSKEEQEEELSASIDFVVDNGMRRDGVTFCYPYGSYNDDAIALAEKYGCRFCLTIVPEVYNPELHSRYTIPRIDTNHITEMMRR
jgi:peptidoglycan/xylan/chitin deacetylase (PgdA/CDA1 family)